MPRQRDCFSLQNAVGKRETVMRGEMMGVRWGWGCGPAPSLRSPSSDLGQKHAKVYQRLKKKKM